VTRREIYFEEESCSVMSVTENATPKIVVHPVAIADNILLAPSELPVKTRGLNKENSESLGISGSIIEVTVNNKNEPIKNNIG